MQRASSIKGPICLTRHQKSMASSKGQQKNANTGFAVRYRTLVQNVATAHEKMHGLKDFTEQSNGARGAFSYSETSGASNNAPGRHYSTCVILCAHFASFLLFFSSARTTGNNKKSATTEQRSGRDEASHVRRSALPPPPRDASTRRAHYERTPASENSDATLRPRALFLN